MAGVPIIGRTAEWAACSQLVAGLAAGQGGVLWLEGEAGIGKSRLVDELVPRARSAGCDVYVGYSDELMAAFPLQPVAESLGVSPGARSRSRAALWTLLHGEPHAEPHADPVRAATERMLALVDELCAACPVMLVVEDVQWADEPTLMLWERLSTSAEQIPLLLVATSRPAPVERDAAWTRLARRARAGHGVHLLVGPLDDDETARLVTDLLGRPPGPRLTQILSAAAGNPLHVREIVRSLAHEDLAVSSEVVDLVPAGRLPASLVDAIGIRLNLVDPLDVQRIRLAALLGHRFTIADLAGVLGVPEDDCAATVQAAETAGLVVLGGAGVSFAHDLLRQVLRDQTPAAIRAGLHGHIAAELARRGATEATIAGHLMMAGEPLPPWAPDWLAEVGESRLLTAATTYAALLGRALRGLADTDSRRGRIGERLVHVLFRLGRDAELIDVGTTVLPQLSDSDGDPDAVARVRTAMLRAHARSGRFADAIAVAQEALTQPHLSPLWHARLLGWSAAVRPYLGELPQAREEAEAALLEAQRLHDGYGIANAHRTLGYIAQGASRLAHLEAGLAALGDDPESTELHMMLLANRAVQLAVTAPREAEAAIAEALILAERAGAYRISVLLSTNAQLFYAVGRWDDALNRIEQIGTGQESLIYLLGLRALIAYRRDQREVGNHLLSEAGVEDVVPVSYQGFTGIFLVEAAALRAETVGDLERALRIRADFLDVPEAVRTSRTPEAPFLIRLALDAKRRDLAESALDVVAKGAPDTTFGDNLIVRCCRAMLHGDAAELAAVADAFFAFGWRPFGAFATEELAAAQAAAGEVDAARTALRAAVVGYEELGALWEIRRCEARLRTHGVRLGVRSPRRRARTGWESLTPTELRVCRLVATGLSNPDISLELIVSRSTVESHVSSILGKLGARSRLDLSRLVREHDSRG